MKYVLGADVLIGALDSSDSHHARAREWLTSRHAQGDATWISVVNLSEVLVAPATDPRRLRLARSAIVALGVAVHVPTEGVGVDAARLRGRHPISLPDAYLLATARHTGASAVSFDQKIVSAAKAEDVSVARF